MYHRRSTKRTDRKTKVEPQRYPAADVWAAAAAAHRINGEYLKEITYTYSPDGSKVIATREANKVLMRQLLSESPQLITPEDRTWGAEIQQYFLCKLMDVLGGRAGDFIRNAVDLAGREEIASDDRLAMGTIACLPQSHARSRARDDITARKMEAQMVSQHFGTVDEKVQGQLTVLESRYSERWGTCYVTATVGTNVVLFAHRCQLEPGSVHQFKGVIKAHRDDRVTQLNHVRLKG